ncbi:DUF6153 family protein [Nocardia thailandica]|uniref:DUF6153 family protein n=1 Tax=Nocardia thailandica TaxID=257275 RepID=UPI0002FB99B1|nr:DUF6153 family protein [Nocardia thailandica]
MADRRELPRAPGVSRALGLLALLAGIVAMHAAVFAGPSGHETTGHAIPAQAAGSAPGPAAAPALAPAGSPDHEDFGCIMAGCGEHAGLHGCVFVLVAAAFAIALVLLYRVPGTGPGPGGALRGFRRAPRERAPPWTVLSLAQLSILRI